MSTWLSLIFYIVPLVLYLFFISGPFWISYSLLSRYLTNPRHVTNNSVFKYQIFAVSVALSPIIAALPVTLCLWLNIGTYSLFTSTLSSLVFLTVGFVLDKKRTLIYLAEFLHAAALRDKIVSVLKFGWQELRSHLNVYFILLGSLWILLLAFLLVAISMFDAMPYEKDSLQYLVAANLFLEHGSIEIYPFSQATREFDFYAVSSHPISFISVLILFQQLAELIPLFQDKNVFIQFFHFHALISILLLVHSAGRHHLFSLVGALFLITSPLVIKQFATQGIDVFRFSGLLSIILLLTWQFDNRSLKFSLISGVVAGLVMTQHNLNLIFVPIMFFGCFLFLYKTPTKIMQHGLLVFLGSTLFWLPHVWRNLLVVGSPFTDRISMYDTVFYQYDSYVFAAAHMRNAFHNLLMGVGSIVFLPHIFGFSIIAAIGLLLAGRIEKRIIHTKESFCATICFVSLLVVFLLSSIFGMHELIANKRYLNTLVPIACLIISSLGYSKNNDHV